MWIVRLALRNPYSIAIFALIILILGALSVSTMLVDIFPVIDLPVVGVVWNYPGLSAEEMERRIVTITERALSTTVSDISKINSQSIPGVGNLRVYFQPAVQIGSAIAQISATCQSLLRIMPPGITPPAIFPFNASNVPVAQLTLFSSNLSESTLFDYGLNFVRIKLFTIPGLSTPAPYGGLQRQINVDIDPIRASALGLSPQDISNTLQSANIIIPAGTARMGTLDYTILLNSSPLEVKDFASFPVKTVNNRLVQLSEVATVSDAYADQTNISRINGRRATFLNILKKANASTLNVIESTKRIIPDILATAPEGLKISLDFDQSIFVRASVENVLREAAIAAFLVSLMILLFLGSWQSVIIVCTSIPLSIFTGIICLKLTGETINLMTLGGLSLAIGMLVDDATVEIENINRNLPLSSSITVAILKGAKQIALPAIVATLAICIVFFPIVLLTGPAKFLFTPLAESVVFSMLASYILSRTLVPVLSKLLMKKELPKNLSHEKLEIMRDPGSENKVKNLSLLERMNLKREDAFERIKKKYGTFLKVLLNHSKFVLTIFCLFFIISALLPIFVIGTDFFPISDAGIMKLHFRAPSGTRIEETEKIIEQVENRIRSVIPEGELSTINSNIGVPIYYNLAFVPSDNVGPMDTEISIALARNHAPTASYQRQIRQDLAKYFMGSEFYFQSADIVSQVLNFGLTAPIDVQIEGTDIYKSYEYARVIRDQVKALPGTTDVAIKQVFDYPTLKINVDRVRAAEVGLSERDVANSTLIALSSSSLVAPSYYLNPKNGVNYTVVVKVPLSKVANVQDLISSPITPQGSLVLKQSQSLSLTPSGPPQAPTQTIGNLSNLKTMTTVNEVNHVNVQRVVDITANIDHLDLGSVITEIKKIIKNLGKLPSGTKISIRGQNEVMYESFTKLGMGMILSSVLVYSLMVVLFQSWLDPLIIMIAIPGALSGIF